MSDNDKKKLDYAYRVLHAGLDNKPTSLGMDISLALIGQLAGKELTPDEVDLLERHENMFR